MRDLIKGYIVASVHEPDRQQNVARLKSILPALIQEEAIYPAHHKVPFVSQISKLSEERTGHALNKGEIGCLLSHRSIWRKIAAYSDDTTMFLVLESDSNIEDIAVIEQSFEQIAAGFDLFFWGAWEGHMKLLRSSRKQLAGKYSIGEPLLKSVYCTYGYSLNRAAASYLLKKTARVAYPVDQFKKFIGNGNLRLGGVMPELVTTIGRGKSYIQNNRNSVKEFFLWLVLDFKNALICLFK